MREWILRKGDKAQRERIIGAIRDLDDRRDWRISVVQNRKRRTLAQNNLMWKWLTLVAEAIEDTTGAEKDDVHEFYKAKFCPPYAVEVGGEWFEMRSTTRLSTAEMSAYCERIYHDARERFGVILPTPGLWQETGGDMALLQERMAKAA